MKICFVGNCQNVHLRRWVKYFESESDTVKVISNVSCRDRNCLFVRDVLPSNLGFFTRIPKIGFLISSFFLSRYLRSSKFDLIHIHSLDEIGLAVGIAFLNHFAPLVVSTWGSDILGPRRLLSRLARRYVLQKADLVTATSDFLTKETRKLSPAIERIEVVPFGVDLNLFDPKRFRKDKPNDNILRIGFFKHLKEVYGPEYLIKAFAISSKKFNNAELFLAGKGELRTNLEKLSQKLDLHERVHFLGFIENVPEVMASMDITVMPSLRESFGVAALESEALEVPVVATKVGGIPEVVLDGETGILVTPLDEKALAEAMIKLLSSKELRLRMGKAGRDFVSKNYDWRKNASRMGKLYEKLLKLNKNI